MRGRCTRCPASRVRPHSHGGEADGRDAEGDAQRGSQRGQSKRGPGEREEREVDPGHRRPEHRMEVVLPAFMPAGVCVAESVGVFIDAQAAHGGRMRLSGCFRLPERRLCARFVRVVLTTRHVSAATAWQRVSMLRRVSGWSSFGDAVGLAGRCTL